MYIRTLNSKGVERSQYRPSEMKDYVIRGMEESGNFRFFIAETTELVEGLRKIHNATPTAIAALGRTATATAMMGYMMKNEKDKVSIQIKGENEIKTIIAISNSECEVKAYISNPAVDIPLREDGKIDVGGAIGSGKLILIRDMGLKEPYIGQSELVTGEIAEDLAHYFVYSEQQPSAVALGVLVDRDYTVKAAGGYIIQVMPDADEEAISKLEKNLAEADSISKMISEGLSPESIMEAVFKGFDTKIMDKKEIVLKCDCSREKMESIMISLGLEELESMLDEEKIEIVCHFCNEKYVFEKPELEAMITEIKTEKDIDSKE
jgi:molecular chaperone Hsp33